MGFKKTNELQFNWGSVPNVPYNPNIARSGVTTGTMSGTNTIYSNVLDVTNFDNFGIEMTWTGTPTGTLSVMCSTSGVNFYALTFSPAITQPAGSAGGYLIDLNQLPFRYLMLQYVNASGSGILTAFTEEKDLN